MTDLDTKALEAAARAIYREWHGPTSLSRTSRNYDWNDAPEATRQGFHRDAITAVSAYLAALNETHALVPREASDSMTEAAQDAADDHFSIDADKGPWLRQDGYKAAWAAMIKAALTAQEPRT